MDTKTTLSVVIAIVIILAGVILLTNKKDTVVVETVPIATEVPAGTTMPLNEINLAPEVASAPASSAVTVTE